MRPGASGQDTNSAAWSSNWNAPIGLDPLDPGVGGLAQTKTAASSYTVLTGSGGIRVSTTESGTLYGGAAVSGPSSERETDMLGRPTVSRTPAFGGGWVVTSNAYDSAGNLRQVARTCGQTLVSRTLSDFDDLGEQYRTALDLNGNSTIDLSGPDRVTKSARWYEQDSSNAWWLVVASVNYPFDNAATPFTNSVVRTRLSGFGAQTGYGRLTAESRTIDSLGNQTISSEYVDLASHRTTRVIQHPDSIQPEVAVSVGGQQMSYVSKTGVETVYGYDPFGRQTLASSTGGSRTVAVTTHYNAKGQADWTQDAASNRTSFAYDPVTGFRVSVTDALSNTTFTAYSGDGQAWRQWGSAAQPEQRRFDPWGRQVALATYRQEAGWSGPAWPISAQGDVTRWNYDGPTGLLLNKRYADGTGPAYTYTADGKLATRTWARGITATYSQTTAGELAGVSYSDGTPAASFSYDRGGRQVFASNAVAAWVYAYAANGALTNEFVTSAGDSHTISRARDSLGRPTGFALATAGLAPDFQVVYGHDQQGRIASVTGTVAGATSGFRYQYIAGSDLVAGWSNATGFATIRGYEANRDLLASVENRSGATTVSRFDYVNDALGLRTRRVDNAILTNTFGYDPRMEIAAATMGVDTYSWSYDAIGNRSASTTNGVTHAYSANALNQYTRIANGGVQTLAYDADGNLTNDSVFTYAWDAENRLILASNATTVAAYAYDPQGRRMAKTVNGDTRRFVYDGWAAIRDVAGATTNSYLWGLDVSGTIQGAGGVGGLLAQFAGTSACAVAYDGNGNATDYIDATGAVAGHFEYGPFGNVTAATGGLVDQLPYRFSTKWFDAETGLCQYESRPYGPGVGGWLTRDSIGEDGGDNLYGFVGNDPVSDLDVLGQVSGVAAESDGWLPGNAVNPGGWAIIGTGHFPGPGWGSSTYPGWTGEFRGRPDGLFDFAAKLHDLHYFLNQLEFGFGSGTIGHWASPFREDGLTLSRKAKADYIFTKMNAVGTGGGAWVGVVSWLARRVFYDDPKWFCPNDGFKNALTYSKTTRLDDPREYLMIPYGQLREPRPTVSVVRYLHGIRTPRNARTVQYPDYMKTTDDDTAPGWRGWAATTYGRTWTRIQEITDATDSTFTW